MSENDPSTGAFDRAETAATAPVPPPVADRSTVVARQRAAFGGVKVGSAFFGWLVATGMTVLLTALVAAAGAGVGEVTTTGDLADTAAENGVSLTEITWAGVVLVLVLVFVAYLAGGYVAGRMARLDGARQGFAVWGWAVLAAVLLAVVGAVAGSQYNVLDDLGSFPNLPSSLDGVGTEGLVVLGGVVVVSLLGAILGGLAGMRYHRKLDQAGLTG